MSIIDQEGVQDLEEKSVPGWSGKELSVTFETISLTSQGRGAYHSFKLVSGL